MSPNTPSVRSSWFEDAFGEYYPIVYAHRTVEAAEPEARFAAEGVNLSPPDRLLDLCCGNGRHLVHLARIAGHVVGLDYSLPMLGQARSLLGSNVPLVRADMRAIPFVNAFDVITNFFTSFGYFLQHEDNARVAAGMARALRSGGRFFLDYANASRVRETLEPSTLRRSGPFQILERRWIDDERRRVNKTTAIMKDGEVLHESEESVYLYTEEEMARLLDEVGLSVDAVYGDYTGVPLDSTQPRMLFVGRKG